MRLTDANNFYTVENISDRLSETPEGFLLCRDVPITRDGVLAYLDEESTITPDGSGVIKMLRSIEDLSDEDTIASFEGKPVTIGHPGEFVGPENFRRLAVGVVQNVRVGSGDDSDKLLADLLIQDREAIQAVKEGKLRQVSCGYEVKEQEVEPGLGRHTGIIGNHVALVEKGRCGNSCAIIDQDKLRARFEMPKKQSLKDKLIGAFSKAVDEAMPEEVVVEETKDESLEEMLASIIARLEKLEAAKMDEDSTEEEVSTDACSSEKMDKLDKLISKLDSFFSQKDQSAEQSNQMSFDQDTLAKAEVLAPGIKPSKTLKMDAIKAALDGDCGAEVRSVIGSKKLEDCDIDLLFNACASVVSKSRDSSSLLHKASSAKKAVVYDVNFYNTIGDKMRKGENL